MAARIVRFCTLGTIEDALYGGSRTRIMMWPLAAGVAITASFVMAALGMVDLENSVYLSLEFSPLASIAGGLTFGIGMALAGNCGFGALSRIGGGDMRSFIIVLIIGIAAYMVSVGPLSEMRLFLFHRDEIIDETPPGFAHAFEKWFGLPGPVTGIVIGVVLLAIALLSSTFRGNLSALFWSAAIGLMIAVSWWGTSTLARGSFEIVAVESHSFTMPLGETLMRVMTSTIAMPGFSVGSVAGVLVGAFIGALWRKQFHWEACDDPRELRRQILGGFLMGVGGVVAIGCSVGQGLSALSVLAFSAPVTMISIVIGAVLGLRYLVEGVGLVDLLTFRAFRDFLDRASSRSLSRD